jgi:hypothetical protein
MNKSLIEKRIAVLSFELDSNPSYSFKSLSSDPMLYRRPALSSEKSLLHIRFTGDSLKMIAGFFNGFFQSVIIDFLIG